MNLTKGFNLLSLFKSDGSDDILKEIEDDFLIYPDLNKIDITHNKARDDKYQHQFDDFLQLNYTFGKFHKKKNTPLAPFQIKRVTINHVPGHIIHIMTSFDKLIGKEKHQKNFSEIIVWEKDKKHEIYSEIKFSKAGRFIRKFKKIFLEKYPKLEPCSRINYRGILDVDNNIAPVIGSLRGRSNDNLDYTYQYRSNENPDKLFGRFKYTNRDIIEKELRDRDRGLYEPMHRKEALRIKHIELELMGYLKPLEKYCNPMFGAMQKYAFEHNDNKGEIKISFMIKDIDMFKYSFGELLPIIPEFFNLDRIKYQENSNLKWGFLNFTYHHNNDYDS
tara:strand:- start:51807 stop:52805 length:999 start_codon:yes stop_codon:yes gene_type:complete